MKSINVERALQPPKIGGWNWSKRLDIITNIAILFVCSLLGYIAITRYVVAPHLADSAHRLPIGEKLTISGVDWTAHRKSLVMVLSTQCHFCTESAPSYRTLISKLQAKGIQVVAIFPQPTQEGEAYFKQLQVPLPDIHQVSLASLGVTGTPTLLVVDAKGTVVDGLVGQLTPGREPGILGKFGE